MSQIEFFNLTKQYENGFYAVKDVSFAVSKGEFVFIVGSSGAGKSTLVRCLIREEEPTAGQILFNGKNVIEIPKKELPELRRQIGVVFQDFKVLDTRNVADNVAVALEVVNTPAEVKNEIIPNVLNMVGLQDKSNLFPYQLSGGEKQRLSIARALAHEPDVLVADEPTGMIDPKATWEVMEILEKINTLGTTILMATHDQSIVDKLRKRVVRIEKGQIVSDVEKGKYEE
ncbi:cell division ATP-binding protein FtsE [Candidatus Nomurabacteria bacterium]|uniref:Cell division ATP-binding protein FtsE n=1 Tax=candidate division WWE3 bacterium TaxID=2053526 RepID=A0A955E0B5_UNCKA|nr:cell division ATP-binding protein FtsE [candidate division WWE3 bacterium]MCB9823847.1 cell division ATP-binding protein FtsE [Candidatus Nomurabacteria bacterium]MCB9826748.1 cell division ATP-binding protein FtsE [Candidatus Nomurabacteria bacterium]MCB9827641.1 cell division ATP-binding protein FtsE [Candidatus Nomurabacteria bacterium]HXK52703.1 cell division ATP-binding protein FtsE [bacterium]